jgi:preprotein translocase subunit SecB
MAEDGNVISSLKLDGPHDGPQNGPLPNGEDTAPAVGIISQYVKDLSVENPNAPACFQWPDAPQLDVQFNIAATPVQGDVHELELKIRITAKAEAGTAYIVDLSYVGLIGMRNLDDAQAHAFLFAEGPRILFPFARRVVADAVRDAGFAPLLLEPIDFNGIYLQQLAATAEAREGETPVGQA